MAAQTNLSATQVKICSTCGTDVSGIPRFRTPEGIYYCSPCYKSATPPNAGKPPPMPPGGAPVATPAPVPAGADPADSMKPRLFGLVPTVVCPHCWHRCSPADVMWISGHGDLNGDTVLGAEQRRRFCPTRFTISGQAIDERGVVCHHMACPRCHLVLPRSSIEAEPLFISIIGGPRTGKSYLLAAMTWGLRKRLPSAFLLSFNDADAVTNQHLNDYEAKLFLSEDADTPVALEKTQESGDLYSQTNINGKAVLLPRPCLFNVRPMARHVNGAHPEKFGRVLCMYDNAGESYQPGKDTMASPATQHLAASRVLMFLFDPTQDARFREKCRSISSDPQLISRGGTQHQAPLLNEAAARVRRYANLPAGKRYDRPLVVLVTKSDVWGSLIDEEIVSEPIIPGVNGQPATVDVVRIERVSRKVKALLELHAGEVVTAAEDFCEHVVYVPVSPIGRSPEEMPLPTGGTGLFIRPRDIAPRWAAVPMLYMFARWSKGLIGNNASGSGRGGTAGRGST